MLTTVRSNGGMPTEEYGPIEQTELEQASLERGVLRRYGYSLGGIRDVVSRDSDRRILHDSRSVDQPEIQIAVLLPPDFLVQATDLFVQRAAHNQRVQVAEALTAQQLLDGHGMRPEPIRRIAEPGQD